MTQTISITLVKSLIIEAVKNETYLTGQIDKAADQKAATIAYHEQAGNDLYQERIILRGLYTAIEDLKTHLSDYLSTTGFSSADNAIGSSESNDNIIIYLKVSDRFNKGYTQSLARLSSKYIEESILMDWWKPISEKKSALYAQFVERGLASIKRCFNKTAPSAPTVPYTSFITTNGTSIELDQGEPCTVTYSISENAVDDVEARVADMHICSIGRSEDGFTVTGNHRGHTYIELYSRHDTTISCTLHVYVTDHS